MKQFLPILFISFFFLSIGCQNLPVPCYTVSGGKTVSVGEVVQFRNCSTFSSSYSWDFGDGGISTEKGPTHTFSSTGNYKVMLTAINKAGESGQVADIVTVQ